ncbi:MAG: hypothetical protein RTU63_13660 [Candidatus Thorarchaeota archaeon]
MPKRKKNSKTKLLVVIVIIALVAGAVTMYHDGLIGVTPLEDIHEWNIIDGFAMDDGTAVSVKGRITGINTIINLVTINDGTGSLGFEWGFADDLEVDSVIVVRGIVQTLGFIRFLDDVSSVQVVWLFA